MLKGVVHVNARSGQPPTTRKKEKIAWVRGIVCCGTQNNVLIVVLNCIAVHTLLL
jgi:hypothetical protein